MSFSTALHGYGLFSTLCSSEFSGSVFCIGEDELSAKWTLAFLHKLSSFVSRASKCIFRKCIMFIFYYRDGKIMWYKKITFKFLQTWVFCIHAHINNILSSTARVFAHGMLMVHNGLLATGEGTSMMYVIYATIFTFI